MSKSILILGSEGFIGSHLVHYFRNSNYEVFGADIVLKQAKDYFLINPEIPDFSFIFSKKNFDVCINATGAANVQLSFSHPAVDFALNTANVYHMLNAIKDNNPSCKFINLSSAAVYGNPVKLPITEADEIKPLSPYGHHKWYSEQICKQFYTIFGIPTQSLRIFSAYGEGLRKQLFWDIYKKVNAASRNNNKVTLFGTGRESRDFIYITDICRAVETIIKKASFNGEAVNIGSGQETLINKAVCQFVQMLNDEVEVQFSGEEKVGDPLNWRADISILESMDFHCIVPIEKGLNNLTQWLREKV
jgi:UDP-glucose 4-epimerase